MMKVDMDWLTARGWAVLEMALKEMQHKGEWAMQYMVVQRDGQVDVYIPPVDTANDALSKDAMLITMQALVRAQKPAAVMVLADSYVSEATETSDPELLHAMRFMPLEELQRKGLVGLPREVLLCSIQTPVDAKVLKQYYRRDGGRIVAEERDEMGEVAGKLARFFDGQQEAHA